MSFYEKVRLPFDKQELGDLINKRILDPLTNNFLNNLLDCINTVKDFKQLRQYVETGKGKLPLYSDIKPIDYEQKEL